MLDRAAVDAPDAARVYNYWLGGTEHAVADRKFGGCLTQVVPPAAVAGEGEPRVPELVDVWAWRPDTDLLVSMADVLAGVGIGWHVVTSLGGVGRKGL